MSCNMLFSVVCCMLITVVFSLNVNNHQSYGPYVAHWYNLEKCSGPKSRNISTYSAEFSREINVYKLEINLTMLIESTIESVKILVSPLNGNKASQWKYKIDQPCKHPVVSIAMSGFIDLKKCSISKGQHHVLSNITELMSKFFGTQFFYGEFLFKALVMAKKGNILCLKYIVKVEKRV